MTSTRFACQGEKATSNWESGSASSFSPMHSSPGQWSSSLPPRRVLDLASFRPEVEIEGTVTKVLVEHLGAVDVTRLGDLAGRLTPEEQWGVDAAILTVLGLS